MSMVGEREIRTQQRVVAFFQTALGYAYLGDWKDRGGNSNIEKTLLADWLSRQGHSDKIIAKVLFELGKAASLGGSKTLYDANREVYGLLRYGVRVQPDVGEQNVTVWLIDWASPDDNDFGIAEEVTVDGENAKRPDLVLYVNGIALGVLELKRSTVSVTEGIRQNLDNQKKSFIGRFFTTVQLVMAGNDTEGLRYGVIETPEKYWLRWKEAEAHPAAGDNPLLRELSQLCGKERLLEVAHDFVVFDAGNQEDLPPQPVLRGAGGADAGAAPRRRHHLAYPGKRQEPDHGLAGEVDPRARDRRTGADRHRPHRTGPADRTGLQRRQRGYPPHPQRR